MVARFVKKWSRHHEQFMYPNYPTLHCLPNVLTPPSDVSFSSRPVETGKLQTGCVLAQLTIFIASVFYASTSEIHALFRILDKKSRTENFKRRTRFHLHVVLGCRNMIVERLKDTPSKGYPKEEHNLLLRKTKMRAVLVI